MEKIKQRDIHACMLKILKNCHDADIWDNDSFSEYCSEFKHRGSMFALSDDGYVELLEADDSNIYGVRITVRGYKYLAEREAERKDFWKSFFSNFLSGFVVGVLVTVVGGLILNDLI